MLSFWRDISLLFANAAGLIVVGFVAIHFLVLQHRLAPLPRARINDMRLSRKFEDDDSQWLGPGRTSSVCQYPGLRS